MKRVRLIGLCALTPMFAVLMLSGCTDSQQVNLHQSTVSIEPLPSDQAHVRLACAHEQGEETVVHGKVRRNPDNCCDTVTGHIDVIVFSPEGDLFDVTAVDYSPRNIPKSGTKSSSFNGALPYTLPAGYTLKMSYHDGDDCQTAEGPTYLSRLDF